MPWKATVTNYKLANEHSVAYTTYSVKIYQQNNIHKLTAEVKCLDVTFGVSRCDPKPSRTILELIS